MNNSKETFDLTLNSNEFSVGVLIIVTSNIEFLIRSEIPGFKFL